jgi:hypothetical protein
MFNNYISMIFSLLTLKIVISIIISFLFVLLCTMQEKVLTNVFILSIDLNPICLGLIILITIIFIRLAHVFLEKRIINILYIN